MRFLSDDDSYTSKRLMLKFERFSISNRNVELTIRGTTTGDVSSFLSCHCFVCWFMFINRLNFDTLEFCIELFDMHCVM